MAEDNETKEELRKGAPSKAPRGLSIRIVGTIATLIAVVLAFIAFAIAGYVADAKDASDAAETRYIECSNAINDLQAASDFLTTQARTFVVTGRKNCMDAYINELTVSNRRGKAVDLLKSSLSENEEATAELVNALSASNSLANDELVAMNLAASYYGIEDVPEKIANADIDPSFANLSPEKTLEAAEGLVLGDAYANDKEIITASVKASSDALLEYLNDEREANSTLMQNLLFQLRIVVALLLCVVMILVLALFMYVLKPLSHYVKRIENNEPLEADGSAELNYLAQAYNTMYEDNAKRIEQLREFAERDPLTGISNRNGYENFIAKHTRNIALILIDIDNFKNFNEVYGHDTGDAVMVKLGRALSTAFRSTDFPCRLQSDKFAIIMTNMSEGLRDAVTSKMELVNSILSDDSDSLPLITLSVGAAFSTEGMTDTEIFKAAETALRQAQKSGKNDVVFYGESN